MEGTWLIADRDLNEREGLKWLLKSSSIPVKNIILASDDQEFMLLFEKESPDIILVELDMVKPENEFKFQDLIQIYEPVLLLTSAEATFEKARLAIDMQALDLMIKPFSTMKVKSAFQKAARKLDLKQRGNLNIPKASKDVSYKGLFLSDHDTAISYNIAAFKPESSTAMEKLHAFLTEYPFKHLHQIFPLSDMVILLFELTSFPIREQCHKAMRKWEEEFSHPLAIILDNGTESEMTLNQKYIGIRKKLEFTYYKGYRQVVEADSSLDWVHMDPFLTPPEQREWVDMLRELDIEKIKKWLYDEFLQLQEPYPDPGLVRIRLTSILAQIRRFMMTYHIDEQQEAEKEYRYIFNSILYDSVLYRSVQNIILFIQKLFLAADNYQRNSMQNPIERGISYMESNFSNPDLRLEEVAEFVYRNPSYFSHLLASKTGTSFTEVLTGIRMKEAKRLLIETSKPIKEIAVLVGYHNSNYFSKLFKQSIGLSPRQFRDNKIQDEKAQFNS
nr:helix-turn-helix domain-containing protein [Neobacillus sp. Marseille-Q6967]